MVTAVLNIAALEVLQVGVASIDSGGGVDFGAAVEQWNAPLRVQVIGRVGTGKSAVLGAVDWPEGVEPTEVAFDVPGRAPSHNMSDADLVVHVVAGRASEPDAALFQSGHPAEVIVVLNKADAFGSRQNIDDACARAGEVLTARGRDEPVLALISVLARADLTTIDEVASGALLDRYEQYGVAALTQALEVDPLLTPDQASTILHAISGVDAVNRAVRLAVLRIRGRRDGDLLQMFEVLAAGHERIRDVLEQFLRSDAAVLAGMRAALSGGGDEADRDLLAGDVTSEDVAHRRAIFWRDRNSRDADEERAAVAISRGFLRMLSAARNARR